MYCMLINLSIFVLNLSQPTSEFPTLSSLSQQDVTPEDLAAALPAHQPRYIAYSYEHEHDDGRKSYPLCFIFISPAGQL